MSQEIKFTKRTQLRYEGDANRNGAYMYKHANLRNTIDVKINII